MMQKTDSRFIANAKRTYYVTTLLSPWSERQRRLQVVNTAPLTAQEHKADLVVHWHLSTRFTRRSYWRSFKSWSNQNSIIQDPPKIENSPLWFSSAVPFTNCTKVATRCDQYPLRFTFLLGPDAHLQRCDCLIVPVVLTILRCNVPKLQSPDICNPDKSVSGFSLVPSFPAVSSMRLSGIHPGVLTPGPTIRKNPHRDNDGVGIL